MKKIFVYLSFLILLIQCRDKNEDCHVFITIKNNSNHEITFAYSGFPSDINLCSLNDNVNNILSNQSFKYRPYVYDCIETRLNFEPNTHALFIVDTNNYTTDIVPCEDFEERNTILRTYVLTLEDLERMDYTINYPEDASIVVD